MSYSIHGFQQSVLVELGCDTIDAFFLRWFADFIHTSKMETIEKDGERFYWVNHKYVITQNPIMKIKSTDAFGRRLKKMCKNGILHSIEKKNYQNTKKYYRFDPSVYQRMAFDTRLKSRVCDLHPTQKSSLHPTQKSSLHPTQKSSDSSVIDSSIIDSYKERESVRKPQKPNKQTAEKKAPLTLSIQEGVYSEIFGESNLRRLTTFQRDQLKSFENLDMMRTTLQWWAGNGYKHNSIGRMLDRYKEQQQPQTKPGSAHGRESTFDNNLRCLGIESCNNSMTWEAK